MIRTRLLTAAALTTSLALAAPALAGSSATPTPLAGSVGPGFTITLKKDGKAVKTLKPGSYKITVKDRSDEHNFHMLGAGAAKVKTTVDFVGTKTLHRDAQEGHVHDPVRSARDGRHEAHVQGRLTAAACAPSPG